MQPDYTGLVPSAGDVLPFLWFDITETGRSQSPPAGRGTRPRSLDWKDVVEINIHRLNLPAYNQKRVHPEL